VVVPSTLLHERGFKVGDRFTLQLDGGRTEVTVVGETVNGGPGGPGLLTDWETLERLAPDHVIPNHDVLFEVALTPGAGGTAHVVYPLHFAAADAALTTARVTPTRPAKACDCGG
jgi:putative ABC transport system permease protein